MARLKGSVAHGPEQADRRFVESFSARIGAWSGSTAKHQSAVEKRVDQFGIPVDPIRDVLDWLNQNVRSKSGQRITRLIQCLQDYEHMEQSRTESNLPLTEHRQRRRESELVHIEANRLLERYIFHPRLTAVTGRPHWFAFQFYCPYLRDEAQPVIRDAIKEWNTSSALRAQKWNAAHPLSKSTPEQFMKAGDMPYTIAEGDVALIICGIASRGDIRRIRRCELPDCQKFFYAEPSHKRRCSQECTDKKQDDGAFKKHRAQYMQEYRQRLKNGKPLKQPKENLR